MAEKGDQKRFRPREGMDCVEGGMAVEIDDDAFFLLGAAGLAFPWVVDAS